MPDIFVPEFIHQVIDDAGVGFFRTCFPDVIIHKKIRVTDDGTGFDPTVARAVVEAAGIKDILTKSLGSENVFNVVMATWTGLQGMMDVTERARQRGKTPADLLPPWRVVADV